MFKNIKTNKEAKREQKQKGRSKQKEIKQKVKEEKRIQNLKRNKLCSSTEEVQSLKDPSIRNIDVRNDKKPMLKRTVSVNEKAPSVKNDSDQEEEKIKPVKNKCSEVQSQTIFVNEKIEETKVTMEQQEDERVVKSRAQSLLFGKAKTLPFGHYMRKTAVNSDDENLQWDKRLHLIPPTKRMTPFFRKTDWIQKKMPQKSNYKNRISALTKAIGITNWFRILKQKQNSRRSGGQVFSHRMAMRITCKTTVPSKKNKGSAEDKHRKDKARLQENGGDETEEVVTINKESDAKYAVVLPRVKKLAKAKTAETNKTIPSVSNSPKGLSTSKAKPPKPGAKLVLPSKPDLSLLKSMRKPLLENILSDEHVESRGSMFTNNSEELSIQKSITSTATLRKQDGASVLQDARHKLKPSQINVRKMSVGMLSNGLAQPKSGYAEAGLTDRTQREISQCFSNEEASLAIAGVHALYEEAADLEVAQLMSGNGLNTIAQPEFHWTGNNQMSGDDQVCIVHIMLCSIFK